MSIARQFSHLLQLGRAIRFPRLILALVTLVFLAGAVVWEWNRATSPGPLHPSHASIAALSGGSNCAACHGSGKITMTEACLVCHKDIKAQVDRGKGVHGQLPAPLQSCTTCHAEHTGGTVALVSPHAFQAVGVTDSLKFDHSKYATFTLSGKHDSLACMKCHPSATVAALGENTPRFLGLSQDCRSCHNDPHRGTFGPDCLSCHGQTLAFKKADGFVHAKDFLLTGGHAGLACKQCHESAGANSVAALKLHPMPARSCTVCHASPHKKTFVAAVALETGTTFDNSCVICHGSSDLTFLHPTAKMTSQHHALTGFSLAPTHAQVACVTCHKEIGTRRALPAGDDLPARFAKFFASHGQDACGECHESPHRGAMVSLIADATHLRDVQSCSVCHGTTNLTFQSPPATMTAAQHAATGFNLDVPHDRVKCIACHQDLGKAMDRGTGLANRFTQRFPGRAQAACEACHADPHAGQFKATPTQGRCAVCHAPTQFVPSNFDAAAHAKTPMPLTGAHLAIACVACHPKVDKVQRFTGTPTTCSACHTDVHGGRFDRAGMPKAVAGGTDCARCHNTTAFAQVKWTPADHVKWAGYALNGAHATISCESCHQPLIKPDQHGRMFGAAATSCVACHVDVHAGQFAIKGIVDCARCHSDAAKFTQTTFDHQRDSRFRLDAIHVKIACDACHKPVAAGAVSIVRYTPLGVSCRDCHGPGVTRDEVRQ